MANELQIFSADILSPEDVSELDKHIEATINAHKNNRQAINRLVFESVAAITEGERYKEQLSNKGWFSIFVGSITGSNRRLQNKINSSYLAAQYAGQLTMQRLAERNLLSFDLIAVLHNKLYASLLRIDAEFNNIYNGLSLFLKQNRSDMIQLENRIKKLERNVNLLNWQSSIEFQMFDGIEYTELSDIAKIVCLVRDFLDINEGNYSTSDLLLLKSAMNDIGLSPRDSINYFEAIKCIDNNPRLKAKLLGNNNLTTVSFNESLIFIEGLKKLELLSTDEKYIVDTVLEISQTNNSNIIKAILTKNFIANLEEVELDVEVPVFDFLMELVYNINQLSLLEQEARTEILEKVNTLIDKKNYQEALDLLLGLAKANLPEVQNKLGYFYDNGYGVDKDYTKAVEWYKKAAEQGNAQAQNNLGFMYENGKGVEKDATIAFEWYTKAAEQGYADAQFNLGVMYEYGKGVKRDYAKAFEWYRKAAEQGNVQAQFMLGFLYERGDGVEKDFSNAFEWYTKAAEQGYAKAQLNLGFMYENGKGVEKDATIAFEWYRKAAEQGNVQAQLDLGFMYENGKGVEKDATIAFEWYTKAADQDNFIAQFKLGFLYEYGKGVKRNYAKAFEWYTKAADQDYNRAQFKLGFLYEYGKGVKRDYAEAFEWYTKAADGFLADDDAQLHLGFMYEYGKGVKRDYARAFEWYTKAANMDNAQAQYSLGLMYESGKGLKKNCTQAFEWYRKAAEQGFANAQNKLGDLFFNGNSVEQDYTKAVEWYRKAADQGDADAQFNLGVMYKYGKGVEKDYDTALHWYTKAAEQGHSLAIQKIEAEGKKSSLWPF